MLFQHAKGLFVNGLVEHQQGKWCRLGFFGAEELGWIPLHWAGGCGGGTVDFGMGFIVLMECNNSCYLLESVM